MPWKKCRNLAVLMKFAERENLMHGSCLNQHWELSKQLDAGSTNTCIEQIFMACEDMIDAIHCRGRRGGFLQMILKKGITKRC